jgi:hypothetical protein
MFCCVAFYYHMPCFTRLVEEKGFFLLLICVSKIPVSFHLTIALHMVEAAEGSL